MQTIAANGARIAYRLEGPPSAPVVMLSNSLMATWAMWDGQAAALSACYRVLRYDTRGHGASEATPGPYSIELLADDAAALIDALDVGSVHFVGLSMGGMIGQQLGARHPGKVLSLSLCDTASEMPPRTMWDERIATARSRGLAALIDGTIGRWFLPSFVERHPERIARIREMIMQTPVEGYVSCATAVRDMSQTHLLPRIQAPAQIIVGRQDPACTLQASEVLHAHIAGSSLHVIEDAAHLPNIERPARFNELLMDFLSRQAAVRTPARSAA